MAQLASEDPDPAVLRIDPRWNAAPPCPDRATFLADLDRLAGPVVVGPEGVAVRIDLGPRADAAGFALNLELAGDPPERRSLSAMDCRTLTRAAALIVAAALAPVATGERIAKVVPETTTIPVPPSLPRTVERPVAAPIVAATPPTRPRRPRVRWVAALAGGPALGLAPAITGTIVGETGIAWPRLRVLAVGQHVFARTSSVREGVSVRAQTSGAGLHVVGALRAGPIDLELGAGVEAGVAVGGGRGRRVTPQKTARSPWTAIVVRAGIVWPPTSRVALMLRSDVGFAVVRPAIALREPSGLETAWRLPQLVARVLGGFVIRLPRDIGTTSD